MMGTKTPTGPLDEEFESGLEIARAAYAKKVNGQEAEIAHLKNELYRRDSRNKDLQAKMAQLEAQLAKGDKRIQELMRAVNKLNNFKQTVMESFADVADDLPADFSAKQKGMVSDKDDAQPKDDVYVAKEKSPIIRHAASQSLDSHRFPRFEMYENPPKKSGVSLSQSGEDVLNNIRRLSTPSSPSKTIAAVDRDTGTQDEEVEQEHAATPHGRPVVPISKEQQRRREQSPSRLDRPSVDQFSLAKNTALGKTQTLRRRSPSTHRRRNSSVDRQSFTPTGFSGRRNSTPASSAKPALRHQHQRQHGHPAHDVEHDNSSVANDSSSGGTGGGDAGRRTPLLDGRGFFQVARGVLSYDEFTNLLWHVRAYNNLEQSRQHTFDALHQLFGRKHPELFAQFEKMWNH